MPADEAYFRAAHRRIEHLTLILGAGGAALAGMRWGWKVAVGVALGTALAWVNFRWLKQGVAAMTQIATAQAGSESVRIPKRVYVKFFGRVVLLLGVVCAILWRSLLPAAAIFAGLFTLVAAVLMEMIYELVRGMRQPHAG